MQYPNFIKASQIDFQRFDFTIPNPSFQPLPSTQLPALSLVPDISLPREATTFYRALFKSSVEDKLSEFVSKLNELASNYLGELNYYLHLETKKQASALDNEINSGSLLGWPSLSGYNRKFIYEHHFEEQAQKLEVFRKYARQFFDALNSYCEAYVSLANKAQSLYAQIYEQDINLTIEFYQKWISALQEKFNSYLNDLKLFVEKANNEFLKQKNVILQQEANLEKIKNQIEKEKLSLEERSLYNQYLEASLNYLIVYKQYLIAQFEQVEATARVYEAQLQKYQTEISQITTTASYINELVQTYMAKLDIAKANIQANSSMISASQQQLSAIREQVEAQFLENRAKIDKIRAALERNKATVLELEALIKQANSQVRLKLNQYKLTLFEQYSQWLQSRNYLLTYLHSRLNISNHLQQTSLAIKYPAIESAVELNEQVREVLESCRILEDAITMFDKAQVIAASRVSANIVRTITGG